MFKSKLPLTYGLYGDNHWFSQQAAKYLVYYM